MKFLGGLSLLGLLAVMAITTMGNQDQVQRLLGGKGEGLRNKGALKTAFDVQLDQTLQNLYRSASLSYASGGGVLDPRSLSADMASDQPGAKLGRPIREGGIRPFFVAPHGLILCGKVGRGEVRCLAANLSSGKRRSASAATLNASKRLARRQVGF